MDIREIKSHSIKITFILLAVGSVSSSVVNMDVASAMVICVDRYNYTSVIPCSKQNAVDKTSINASQAGQGNNMTTSNVTNTAGHQNITVSQNSSTIPTINASPAKVQLLFSKTDHTGGYIFTTHWVVWGKVANTGDVSSKPVSVQISCTNTNNGAPLYSTTISLVPSILAPGQIGTFSQPISSDDLQGTKYSFSCIAQLVAQ